jgi:hypothetical protein
MKVGGAGRLIGHNLTLAFSVMSCVALQCSASAQVLQPVEGRPSPALLNHMVRHWD